MTALFPCIFILVIFFLVKKWSLVARVNTPVSLYVFVFAYSLILLSVLSSFSSSFFSFVGLGNMVLLLIRACVRALRKNIKKKGEKRTKTEKEKRTQQKILTLLCSRSSVQINYMPLFLKNLLCFQTKTLVWKKTPNKKNNINRP